MFTALFGSGERGAGCRAAPRVELSSIFRAGDAACGGEQEAGNPCFLAAFGKVKRELLRTELGNENYQLYQKLEQVGNWSGMQARLPFLIEIN